MKKISLLFPCLVFAIFFCLAPMAHAAWYNPAWQYRQQITISHTLVASSTGTEAYTSFPVLVSVSSTNLKYMGFGGQVASSTGNDILFTQADGVTKLNHEIESYSSSTGDLVAWVELPSIATSTDTNFYIYYGNANAINQQNVTSTWNANYQGVWHLQETGIGSVGDYKDSTSYANDSNSVSNQPVATSSGQIAGAEIFNGSSSLIAINGGRAYATSAAPFSVSAWVNLKNFSQGSFPVVAELRTNTVDGWTILLSDNSNYLGIAIGAGDGDWADLKTNNTPSFGAWHHIVVTYNGNGATTLSNFQIYLDGSAQSLVGASSFGDNTNMTTIGNTFDNGNPWPGGIEEFHISSAQLSSDWVATEYNNQSSPSTFLSFGSQQFNGGARRILVGHGATR